MGFMLIIFAGILDVIANLCLKKSQGFTNRFWGFGAIAIVLIAFYLLFLALGYVELAVAYAMWGAVGILGTIIGGRIFFNERFNYLGYIGVVLVVCAVALLKFGTY